MLLSDPFEKLKLLLDQGEFELLEDEAEKNKGNRYRLVYLMNDAVESFLVLENGRMTGNISESMTVRSRQNCGNMREQKHFGRQRKAERKNMF